jgi:CxxC-x17-CxxC domain-containing protein
MGNFRDRDFGRNSSRGGFGRDDRRGGRGFGGRSGGRGFGGDRNFSRGDRKNMVDVVCDKCGKDCQVPFKPTGDKPVLCRECFEGQGSLNRKTFSDSSQSSSGISKEQFNELNSKLDRILEILESIEFENLEEGDEEDEEDSEEVEEKAN